MMSAPAPRRMLRLMIHFGCCLRIVTNMFFISFILLVLDIKKILDTKHCNDKKEYDIFIVCISVSCHILHVTVSVVIDSIYETVF